MTFITVRVTRTFQSRWQMWIGWELIRLAGWVMSVTFNIEEHETTVG